MKRFVLNVFSDALAIVGFCTIMISCTSSEEPETQIDNIRNNIELSPASRSAANELRDFYPKFTMDAINSADANTETATDNVIISPISASMMLSMLANGVEPDIASQITDYLGVSDLTALNSLASRLIDALPKVDKKSNLSLSNSVWYADKFLLNTNFSSTISENFMATLRPLDFSQSTALKTVNDWISSTAGGMIDSYFDSAAINGNTIAVILNTLYFNGEWAESYFNPRSTVSETFHGFSGESLVEMMHSFLRTQYGATDRFKACSLYFGNGAFSLTLILPTSEPSQKMDMPEISAEELDALNASYQYSFISLSIPKFNLSNVISLNDILETAGLSELNGKIAFTMFDDHMNNFITLGHGASISVDEEGAKVAATSSGVIMNMAPTVEASLEFNRPFYFFLTETSTGACLLSGRIADFCD